MAYNVFPIDFGDSNATGAGRMMQWDKGQIFKFVDASLEGCEVQFDDGTVKVITNGCISVPDFDVEGGGTITFHQQTTEMPIPNKVEYLVSLREA